jgi:hypothetical protein
MNEVHAFWIDFVNVASNDAMRFVGRRLTENEFWKKIQPECCRPCTSNAFDHAMEANDE